MPERGGNDGEELVGTGHMTGSVDRERVKLVASRNVEVWALIEVAINEVTGCGIFEIEQVVVVPWATSGVAAKLQERNERKEVRRR